MRIVYLLQSADQLWGGVRVALGGAQELHRRGHEVTVCSTTPPPAWMELTCGYQQVEDFEHPLPAADLLVCTDWFTIPHAIRQGIAPVVHFCQSYEGSMAQNARYLPEIEVVYGCTETHKLSISEPTADLLEAQFGHSWHCIPNLVDLAGLGPADPPRQPGARLRVGLVGSYRLDWKDIPTGLQACALALAAGLDLEVVRVSNAPWDPREQGLSIPVEYHEQVPPAQMSELYRSLDLLLGTSHGVEEGFFLPAIEAMACGVPCVLTDIPAFRSYGEEQYALFVPAKDPREMAQAMALATRHEAVRQSLIRNGLATAAQYQPNRHFDALERALQDFHQQSATRPLPPAPNPTQLESMSVELGQVLSRCAEAYAALGRHREARQHLEAARCLHPTQGGTPRGQEVVQGT